MTTKIYSVSDVSKLAGITRQGVEKRIKRLGIEPQKIGSGKKQITVLTESQAQKIIENK